MYRSTIPRRTVALTPNDFAGLPDDSLLSQESREIGIRDIEIWNEYIPLRPIDISRLFNALPMQSYALDFGYEGAGIFQARLPNYDGSIKEAYVDFNLRNMTVEDSNIELFVQATGLGSKIQRAFIELGAALGLEEYSFSASRTLGAYAWAKQAYELSDTFYPDFLTEAVRARLYALEPYLPDDIFNKAFEMSAFCKPDDINNLAAMDFLLPESLRPQDFYRNECKSAMRIAFALAHDQANKKVMGEINCMRELLDLRTGNGREITLGLCLLYKAHYDAKLSFADVRQMSKIERAGGPFKTLALVPEGLVASGQGPRFDFA